MALLSAILVAIGGWHYFCHVRLETGLEKRANESLQATFEGSHAIVKIQPITNLVEIQVELPVHGRNELSNAIGDLLVEYIRLELEPVIERQLITAARSSIDLYAMAVPYHVTIDVTNVREGFSKVVQDVQHELLRLRYDIGSPDGLNGPKTKKAIVHVQAQLKMTQDGQASQELLSRLRRAKPATPNTTLERARGG
jgi:hypothetical protein